MSKDKNIKNNVLTIKSKNSNNSINNLEWVSYEENVVLPVTPITYNMKTYILSIENINKLNVSERCNVLYNNLLENFLKECNFNNKYSKKIYINKYTDYFKKGLNPKETFFWSDGKHVHTFKSGMRAVAIILNRLIKYQIPNICCNGAEFLIHYRINENELEIHKIDTYGLFLKDDEIKKYSYGVSYYGK